MRITEIELYHVQVPLKKTFYPTWIPGYPQTHNGFTLVRLVTDDGIEGYAAGSALGFERQGLGDLIAPVIGPGLQDQGRVFSQRAAAGSGSRFATARRMPMSESSSNTMTQNDSASWP